MAAGEIGDLVGPIEANGGEAPAARSFIIQQKGITMAENQTLEQNGHRILEIYAHFNSKAGDVLRTNNFIAVGSRRRYDMRDLQKGLEFALTKGWIEEAENGGLRLTERGFAKMPQ